MMWPPRLSCSDGQGLSIHGSSLKGEGLPLHVRSNIVSISQRALCTSLDFLRSMLPVVREHASSCCKAMLLDAETYAFGHGNLCFWTRKAMLLKSESNAFEVGKQCFWGRGVMLFTSGSYAFRCCESFRGGWWVILIWHVTSFFMAVALVFSGSCYPCRIAFSNALQSY